MQRHVAVCQTLMLGGGKGSRGKLLHALDGQGSVVDIAGEDDMFRHDVFPMRR